MLLFYHGLILRHFLSFFITENLVTATAYVCKYVAIKMKLLLYRNLYEQNGCLNGFFVFLFSHRTYVYLDIFRIALVERF